MLLGALVFLPKMSQALTAVRLHYRTLEEFRRTKNGGGQCNSARMQASYRCNAKSMLLNAL
jgi:hypothetical protein